MMTTTPNHDHQHHHQFLSRSPSQVELVPSLSSEIGFSSPLHRHLFRMISTRMSGLMMISTIMISIVMMMISLAFEGQLLMMV